MRAQGFPDSYIFAGSLAARYCQVGNAVAPPVALVLGLEMGRVLAAASVGVGAGGGAGTVMEEVLGEADAGPQEGTAQ